MQTTVLWFFQGQRVARRATSPTIQPNRTSSLSVISTANFLGPHAFSKSRNFRQAAGGVDWREALVSGYKHVTIAARGIPEFTLTQEWFLVCRNVPPATTYSRGGQENGAALADYPWRTVGVGINARFKNNGTGRARTVPGT